MDKKITIFAKIGLILVAIASWHIFFNGPYGSKIFGYLMIFILPIFFVLNFIRELKDPVEPKTPVFMSFLSILSFLFGIGFKILKYQIEVNFFLISIGFLSLFLLTNGLEKIKENKKNILPFLIYPNIFFWVILSLRFYLLPDFIGNEWLIMTLFFVFLFVFITYVILQVNLIKNTDFKLSNYNKLKLVVLFTTVAFYVLNRLHNSIPIRSHEVSYINLSLLQEENENQLVLGDRLITEKNKKMVSLMDLETQKIIKKIDSLKLVFLCENDENFYKKNKIGELKSKYNSRQKLMPISIKSESIIRGSSHMIELTDYDYPYKQIDIYRKKILKIVFPKLTKIPEFDDFRNSEDLALKITKYADDYKLTTDEKRVLLMILMIDSKNTRRNIHDSYDDFRKLQFEFLNLISAINILTNLQNEILSTRTLIISHI